MKLFKQGVYVLWVCAERFKIYELGKKLYEKKAVYWVSLGECDFKLFIGH